MSYDEVRQIIKLIDGSSCDEFVLETEDIKLVVRRRGANGAAATDAARDSGTIWWNRPRGRNSSRSRNSNLPPLHLRMLFRLRWSVLFTVRRLLQLHPSSRSAAKSKGRSNLHHRSDETLYDHSLRMERYGEGDRSQKRAARGIRPDALRHHSGVNAKHETRK